MLNWFRSKADDKTLDVLWLECVQAEIARADMRIDILLYELSLNRHTYGGTALIKSELYHTALLRMGLRIKEKHQKLDLGQTEIDIQNLASIRASWKWSSQTRKARIA